MFSSRIPLRTWSIVFMMIWRQYRRTMKSSFAIENLPGVKVTGRGVFTSQFVERTPPLSVGASKRLFHPLGLQT